MESPSTYYVKYDPKIISQRTTGSSSTASSRQKHPFLSEKRTALCNPRCYQGCSFKYSTSSGNFMAAKDPSLSLRAIFPSALRSSAPGEEPPRVSAPTSSRQGSMHAAPAVARPPASLPGGGTGRARGGLAPRYPTPADIRLFVPGSRVGKYLASPRLLRRQGLR